jgi:excisionase family DNA binding protein
MNETNSRNVYDVAAFLGVTHGTVRQWIRQGTLEAIKIGRRVLVPQSAINRLVGEAKKATAINEKTGIDTRIPIPIM